MATLDFELVPGISLGRFALGTSLWTVLENLRELKTYFPQVDIKYDTDAAVSSIIILHLRPHLDLLFSPLAQRLHTIVLGNLHSPGTPPLTLRYKEHILSSKGVTLSRGSLSKVFGPTYEWEVMKYPGVSFAFDDGTGTPLPPSISTSPTAHQRTRDGDKKALVKRIVLTQKSSESEYPDPFQEVFECPAMDGELAKAIVRPNDGVVLHFHPSSVEPIYIQLGITTAEDLNVDLGTPLRVHYKEDDRMAIHSTHKDDTQDGYFYNYFQYGLDFFISGTTHTVIKILLHSNVPGSPLFQRYKRCQWEIEGQPEDDEDFDPARVTFVDKIDKIAHFLDPTREPPPSMLLDRAGEDENLSLPDSTTRLMGFDGMVLEVSESDQVLSVMLF